MLQEWIAKHFRPRDGSDVASEIVGPLRRVRDERQQEAHKISQNEYDERYHRMQDDLIEAAYDAVRTLRLCMANHPSCAGVRVPDWLYEGKIEHY